MVMYEHRTILFSCPRCSWRHTIPGRGDALISGMNHFTVCPTCGCEEVKTSMPEPSLLAQMVSLLFKGR